MALLLLLWKKMESLMIRKVVFAHKEKKNKELKFRE
jgi:hypothetical protein